MVDNHPQVAVILVNWNRADDTVACLESLRRATYPALQPIVVDNGSTDGLAGRIRADFPEVVLIENAVNLGFVGGNNLGLQKAEQMGAEWILLLNNDTEVDPGFLDHLVAVAQTPGVGIVGPLIYYHGEPERIWSAGGRIDWTTGNPIALGEDVMDIGQYGVNPYAVDYVTGCALMIRRSVVAAVGPLDPRFFAYYEEIEWCVRASRAGQRILVVPAAHVWHKITREARFASASVGYYLTRNRLLFLWLSGAGARAWFYSLVMQIGRTILAYTLLPKWRHKHESRRAMIDGVVDFFFGRFGQRPARKPSA